MFCVYWTEVFEGEATPCSQSFPTDGLMAMLRFSEDLRARRRAGDQVSFIGSVSEHPDMIGEVGVAAPAADYDWTKRRGGRRR